MLYRERNALIEIISPFVVQLKWTFQTVLTGKFKANQFHISVQLLLFCFGICALRKSSSAAWNQKMPEGGRSQICYSGSYYGAECDSREQFSL